MKELYNFETMNFNGSLSIFSCFQDGGEFDRAVWEECERPDAKLQTSTCNEFNGSGVTHVDKQINVMMMMMMMLVVLVVVEPPWSTRNL